MLTDVMCKIGHDYPSGHLVHSLFIKKFVRMLPDLTRIDTPNFDILIWYWFRYGQWLRTARQVLRTGQMTLTWSHSYFVKDFVDSKPLFFLFSFYLLVCFKFVLSLCTFDLSHGYSTMQLSNVKSANKYIMNLTVGK